MSVWLVLVLVFLVAFGPIMWLRPSARDKRLATLRAHGRTLGFGLDMKSLPRLDAAPEERVSAGGVARTATELLAVYRWVTSKKLEPFGSFRLLRGPTRDRLSRGAVEVAPGWYFEPDLSFPPDGWSWFAPQLTEVLSGWDDGIRALAFEPRAVAVYWREGPGADTAVLDQIKQRIQHLEAQLRDAVEASADGL
ncbi:MAG: hypothetical protein AAF648_12905 [Pseudomonadota bacterium]